MSVSRPMPSPAHISGEAISALGDRVHDRVTSAPALLASADCASLPPSIFGIHHTSYVLRSVRSHLPRHTVRSNPHNTHTDTRTVRPSRVETPRLWTHTHSHRLGAEGGGRARGAARARVTAGGSARTVVARLHKLHISQRARPMVWGVRRARLHVACHRLSERVTAVMIASQIRVRQHPNLGRRAALPARAPTPHLATLPFSCPTNRRRLPSPLG